MDAFLPCNALLSTANAFEWATWVSNLNYCFSHVGSQLLACCVSFLLSLFSL